MHILVLGAAGMVGRKLIERLLRDGRLGKTDITAMTLQDVVAPATPDKPGFPIHVVTGDFAMPGFADQAGRRQARRDLPSRRDRFRRGRARFRQGLPDQSRRHPDAVRRDQAGRRRLQAARGVHLVDRGVRRAVPRRDRRRILPYPAVELRHPKGDRRIAAGGLFTPRLHGRHRHPTADHLHPARPAQQGRVRLFLQHPARASGRQGSDPAGIGRRAALARDAALGGRLPAPRRDHGSPRSSDRAAACRCPACRPRSASRSRP